MIEKLTGDRKYESPYLTEYRAEIVRWYEDCYAATDALGLCVFTSTAAYGVTPENMAEMFSAATRIGIWLYLISLTNHEFYKSYGRLPILYLVYDPSKRRRKKQRITMRLKEKKMRSLRIVHA